MGRDSFYPPFAEVSLTCVVASPSGGIWVRAISIKQYFATRNPIAGAAYCLLLIVFRQQALQEDESPMWRLPNARSAR